MANVTITNVTSSPIFISDIYDTIAANSSITVSRAASDLPRMASLQHAMAQNQVTITVAYTADELASGLQQAPQSVSASDMLPVAAATPLGGCELIRVAFAAGAGGAADDVTVYAVNTLPYKFRVVNAWSVVLTAVASSTLQVWTRAAGAGTKLAQTASAAAGFNAYGTLTATALIAPAALDGLFVRRSDSGIAGEVFLLIRAET